MSIAKHNRKVKKKEPVEEPEEEIIAEYNEHHTNVQ
jgi:hypothetical protein